MKLIGELGKSFVDVGRFAMDVDDSSLVVFEGTDITESLGHFELPESCAHSRDLGVFRVFRREHDVEAVVWASFVVLTGAVEVSGAVAECGCEVQSVAGSGADRLDLVGGLIGFREESEELYDIAGVVVVEEGSEGLSDILTV